MARRKAGLGFIMVTLFLDVLGIGLIVPILPRLLESFVGHKTDIASAWFAALSGSYALMQFVFSPILGSVSDRSGRRSVLLVSVFGQALGYLVLGLSPNLAWLFAGRIISGITSASIGTATAYIADVSPPEKRAQNFGLVGVAFGLGFIAGPLLGGLLGRVSLHLPFLVAAGLSLANGLYGLFVLPESLDAAHRRPFSWARANPVGALKGLTRYPAVAGLVASIFLSFLAQRGLENTWVLAMGYRFQWDVTATGISLAVVGLGAAIVQGALVRRIVPALGERRALQAGMLAGIVAFVLYGAVPQGWMIYLALPIGSFFGIAGPATQGMLSKAVGPSEQGMLQGGLASLQSVTQVLGPLVGSSLFGFFISDDAPVKVPGATFYLGAFFIFLSLVLARRTFARTPETAPAGAPVTPEAG